MNIKTTNFNLSKFPEYKNEISSQSILVGNLREFLRDKIAVTSTAIVFVFILLALTAPLITPHDPNESDLMRRLQPPVWMEGGETSIIKLKTSKNFTSDWLKITGIPSSSVDPNRQTAQEKLFLIRGCI